MSRSHFVILTAIALTACVAGCDEDEAKASKSTCPDRGSIDDVPWIIELQESMTNCTCAISIIRGAYEGQTVIYVAMNDPLCDGINTPTLHNCDGKAIRSFTDSPDDQKELREKVTPESILYTCKQ